MSDDSPPNGRRTVPAADRGSPADLDSHRARAAKLLSTSDAARRSETESTDSSPRDSSITKSPERVDSRESESNHKRSPERPRSFTRLAAEAVEAAARAADGESPKRSPAARDEDRPARHASPHAALRGPDSRNLDVEWSPRDEERPYRHPASRATDSPSRTHEVESVQQRPEADSRPRSARSATVDYHQGAEHRLAEAASPSRPRQVIRRPSAALDGRKTPPKTPPSPSGMGPFGVRRPSASAPHIATSPSAIDDCLGEVEAALNHALRVKEETVGVTAPQGPLAAVQSLEVAAPPAVINKKRVQINAPEKPDKPAAAATKLRPSLMIGSGMLKAGEWDNEGWRELSAEGVVPIPAILQQIDPNHVEKVRELGRGQFGSVLLSRWLGVDVAVKELRNSSDAHSNAELLREAELLASLCHPCVTTIYGVMVRPDEGPATVMEFVKGGSLRSCLQALKAQGISATFKCAIALQAARGFEYLHARNVVHFDVKAENLLADLRDLQHPVVKIADMGLSKRSAATTVSGNMRGTLPWMAPELFPQNGGAGGVDRVTGKVDVFSFGVVMWEIWTLGEAPYPGLKLPAVFSGVASGTLRPRALTDAPADWTTLMQECWAGTPTQRPTFSQVATRLESLRAVHKDSP
ncbi:hypothetical protein WJX73_004778 [Symbiochloris irregularis]|uniref:Protein kinase domain-containing protein n=1 Tax=Symbiochloris irregularis TaxID=706552 RepID=A0AAW1PS92_9CHLO